VRTEISCPSPILLFRFSLTNTTAPIGPTATIASIAPTAPTAPTATFRLFHTSIVF